MTQATHYEAALLGALINGEQDARSVLPRLTQADFSAKEHKEVFLGIETLDRASQPYDMRILTDWVLERFKVTDASERQVTRKLITDMCLDPCLPSLVPTYVDKVKRVSLARALYDVAEKLDEGADPIVEAQKIARQIEQPATGFGGEIDYQKLETKYTFSSLGDVAQDVLKQVLIHNTQSGTITGVPSGFADLDDVTLGFQNGELVIVGARPGEGKTVLGMDIAINIAIDYGLPVLFVCLEMSKEALGRRYLASRSGVETRLMRTGDCGTASLAKLEKAAFESLNVPITIADQKCGIKTVGDIETYYRQLEAAGTKACIVIVDHLHLLKSEFGTRDSFERVSEVSTSLKELAGKRLAVPVMALCQLKRPDKPAANKRDKSIPQPNLTDLRSSGNIEQDADHVIFVHRPAYHDYSLPSDEAVLLVRKNREGESNRDIEVKFHPALNTFRSIGTRPQFKLFKPELVPQPEEEAMPDPEEEYLEPLEYSVSEDRRVFTVIKTGQTLRVWSDELCDQKIADAMAHDGAKRIWQDGEVFIAGRRSQTEKAWASACVYERLSDAYDRALAAPAAVTDEEWASFGF